MYYFGAVKMISWQAVVLSSPFLWDKMLKTIYFQKGSIDQGQNVFLFILIIIP